VNMDSSSAYAPPSLSYLPDVANPLPATLRNEIKAREGRVYVVATWRSIVRKSDIEADLTYLRMRASEGASTRGTSVAAKSCLSVLEETIDEISSQYNLSDISDTTVSSGYDRSRRYQNRSGLCSQAINRFFKPISLLFATRLGEEV
jgi:hypothetical protein